MTSMRTRAVTSPIMETLGGVAVTTVIIFSGAVDQIQQYAGMTLSLFASLAVLCVVVLRFRRPDMERPFRAWGYPVTPLLFLGIMGWTMVWAARGRPLESALARPSWCRLPKPSSIPPV